MCDQDCCSDIPKDVEQAIDYCIVRLNHWHDRIVYYHDGEYLDKQTVLRIIEDLKGALEELYE